MSSRAALFTLCGFIVGLLVSQMGSGISASCPPNQNYASSDRLVTEWKQRYDALHRELVNLKQLQLQLPLPAARSSLQTPSVVPPPPPSHSSSKRIDSAEFWKLSPEEKKRVLLEYHCVPNRHPNRIAGTFIEGKQNSVLGDFRWIENLPCAEYKVHSQNREDGVIAAIMAAIGTQDKTYIEFGTETGIEINTHVLRKEGWSGLLLDGGNENLQINLRKEIILEENIVSLFEKYGMGKDTLDLLSVDTDCYDFWILRNILKANYRPRMIVVELNSKWATNLSLVIPPATMVPSSYTPNGRCEFTDWFGVSVAAYHKMGECYGYKMIYCENVSVNGFLVRKDLLPFPDEEAAAAALTPTKIWKHPRYGTGGGGGHMNDPKKRHFLEINTCDDIEHPENAPKVTREEAIGKMRWVEKPPAGEEFTLRFDGKLPSQWWSRR